jgi:hypothetical protein
MNNTIKDYITEFKKHHRYNPTILGKIKRIENYITNLQEENKEWSMIFDTFSKRPYAHKYLEEKKKELGNKKIIGLDSEMIYKDYYDCKSRIDKANDYIDKHTIEWKDDKFEEHNIMVKFNEYSNPQELKNILGGDE